MTKVLRAIGSSTSLEAEAVQADSQGTWTWEKTKEFSMYQVVLNLPRGLGC